MGQRIDRLFATLDEVHILYHGFYRNVEVRISGNVGFSARDTRLFVKMFWNGHRINSYTRPFNTMATARKYAQRMAEENTRMALIGRRDGWTERCDYAAHMPDYRNYHADRGLPYYDYRRKDGPVIYPQRKAA
jgi:hypothetical protein